MKREILEVTEADIALARAERFTMTAAVCCPVAQALRRQHHREAGEVFVVGDWLRIGDCYSRPLSNALRAFIDRWDIERSAQPARFLVVWED